jgi:hypothetical protein
MAQAWWFVEDEIPTGASLWRTLIMRAPSSEELAVKQARACGFEGNGSHPALFE